MSTISAILPYFGGKRNMAAGIVDLLTEGRDTKRYVEPFHGSLAVLLELRRLGYAGQAIVNDLNGHVHNLAKCLADSEYAGLLHDALSLTPFHEAVWRHARNVLSVLANYRNEECHNLLVATHYFIASWMGRNGEAGGEDDWAEAVGGFCCRFTTSGGDPALRWQNAVASIPEWFKALSVRTQYLSRDAIDVLESVPDGDDLAIYLDPPYLHATRGSARYAVDVDDYTGGLGEAEDFHSRLRESLEKFEKARVVVSYYDHPRLDSLYAGWTKHTVSVAKATAQSARGAKKREATEVLFVR